MIVYMERKDINCLRRGWDDGEIYSDELDGDEEFQVTTALPSSSHGD